MYLHTIWYDDCAFVFIYGAVAVLLNVISQFSSSRASPKSEPHFSKFFEQLTHLIQPLLAYMIP